MFPVLDHSFTRRTLDVQFVEWRVKKGDGTLPQVDETSNGKEVELPVGETLEIRLPENRTAGFQWVLDSSSKGVCSFVSDDYEPGHLIGEPGIHRWHFRAERAGADSIKLSYRRPWDEKGKPERSFSLSIRVK